jgi:hypothetical protein
VFNWVVSAINARLDMGRKASGRFIAILDIYGFEQFTVNRCGGSLLRGCATCARAPAAAPGAVSVATRPSRAAPLLPTRPPTLAAPLHRPTRALPAPGAPQL